jgi:hypothetical protein
MTLVPVRALDRTSPNPLVDRPPPMAVTTPERPGISDPVPSGNSPRAQDERARTQQESSRECRWARRAFAILIVAGLVGDIAMPAMVERFPLLLILLSPRWRMILLVSRRLDPLLLIPLGFVRRLLTVVVLHRVGRCGTGRSRGPRSGIGRRRRRARRFQRWLKGSSALLLFVFPGAAASFLAGVEAMSLLQAVAIAGASTLVRLLILTHVAGAFAAPLDQAIRFIGAHHLQFTVVILTWVVVRTLRSWVPMHRRTSGHEAADGHMRGTPFGGVPVSAAERGAGGADQPARVMDPGTGASAVRPADQRGAARTTESRR